MLAYLKAREWHLPSRFCLQDPSEQLQQHSWKSSSMPGITCTDLHIAPGQRIAVKGEVPSGAKSFVINLGKKADDLIIHFNARFDAHGDVKTIVCNSKSGGQWGKEHRESNFPFQEGSTAEIIFAHDKNEVTITLPGNHQFKIPNSSGQEGIEYICVTGDVAFKGISLV
ncbi:galectin-1 [Eublepharis macularius]|uniref:Galectin n=1 Tax=Eublepharis macularius TaxID=481883 RepID=A0AA97JTB5_EUBMA|nr:galectin-1 [Eublepharis macularius]